MVRLSSIGSEPQPTRLPSVLQWARLTVQGCGGPKKISVAFRSCTMLIGLLLLLLLLAPSALGGAAEVYRYVGLQWVAELVRHHANQVVAQQQQGGAALQFGAVGSNGGFEQRDLEVQDIPTFCLQENQVRRCGTPHGVLKQLDAGVQVRRGEQPRRLLLQRRLESVHRVCMVSTAYQGVSVHLPGKPPSRA
eukprot:scaffold34977_cov48-Phaeocystis_antarctica.AAC.1